MTALPLTIPHAAEAAARRWPDAVALIEGAQTRTFAQLWQECRAAASALLERGVKDGDRIAIWAPNCREWVVAAVAAQACGAAIVPLNTRLKGREAGDILRRTHARMLFTVAGFLGIDYPALLAAEDLPDLAETVLLDRDFAAFVASGKGAADPRIDASLATLTPDHVSDIMFTSGTTGVPKGVLMTHGRILPQVGVWIGNTGLAQGERYLIANPFFHSFGMKVGWVACLLAGAVMVPMPQFDVAEAIRLIEQERIAFLPGPPTIFQMLLAERDQRPFDCSSLRGGTTGAATVPPVLIERIRSELGMKDIITAYGMTECVNITSCRPGDPVELIAQTCGAAIPGNEVIIAGENGEELPRGETGEILVRGTGVMLGYLDDPAATAEAIDAAGWLHTGDVGTMDANSYVRITDRKKDMFISGGFNVYPAEVEKILSAHPAVGMVAVVGAPDERMGEIGVAFIVPRSGAPLDEAEVLAWCRANMANYKVPRRIVAVADLPRNASGKVLKIELKA
ncbi:FadD3 family acyl-CoA ligase [Novosphingobium sp.]|uniref:FadD3 family acyl-CoA ligase n=1 Tax=Novosphingobium sp. TaxID=1874826 RepID=UPI0022C1EFAD|nr:FadD3 family acyl-CoA ligase [Novosphingobium sp.]MCZ8018371.1 FadD3 family acyl-CoA ligase [Novosphingobium sp.]MCZ8033365.1 FadD3 family acyl-CoA ligase [Novosphingobium sp.]MCZ8051820.1 FadD3 family acyl-CoA ligase [Novosphingobium sp.]MCZ8060362.1 FadD3 family acyl-CoA ligase [Novosphingobium sp.]MCZ8232004.1 FadD3 family acyl-CoA ligase [Novosphingobium sp.]